MAGDPLVFPDGVDERHLTGGAPRQYLSWTPLLVLGGVLALALSGVFGGQTAPTQVARGEGARFEITVPATLRNGQIFEMEIRVAAERNIASPVIAVDAAYWRNLTLNTVRPEAASQEFRNGAVRLEYPPLAAGETLTVTFEGQVNPVLGQISHGMARLQDGDTVMAEIPLELKVWP
jgi:hypothetical protein